MTSLVPLPTLLSQTYVAFTIEFDNEWERRLHAGEQTPRFLVSYALWANLMRWVRPEGIRLGQLEAQMGVWNGPIHLDRMSKWWGYLSILPDPALGESKSPRGDLLVKPTDTGEIALAAWDGLDTWVRDAWSQRFGDERLAAVVNSLATIEEELDLELPGSMPVLGYADGYATPRPVEGLSPARSRPDTLGGLIARVLLAFTLEYERDSVLSLAMGACVLRVLGVEPISVKEVPVRAGVRREATDPALKFLAKRGYLETNGTGAKATVRLTTDGTKAKRAYLLRVGSIEGKWSKRFGEVKVATLRDALGAMFEDNVDGPLIAGGLAPAKGCWRGTKPYLAQTELFLRSPRDFLPHHPLLTHRGGWPDGA